MDQLSAMRVFVRVVESGNFSRAAETLSIPKATVTNLVQGLETHLRTKLLNRTTRRVTVTTDGALYYERAAQLLTEIDELDNSLSNSHSAPTGRLRVEMAGAFAESIVIPALCDFYKRYPDIRVDLGVGDRLVDYLAENVDCALRAGTPMDQSLIARKVIDIDMITCAAPAYIEKFGLPEHPEDLRDKHVCVAYLRAQTSKPFPFEFVRDGQTLVIDSNYLLSVNDGRSYLSAAFSGLGVVQSPRFMVRDAIESGRLRQVLADWQIEPMPAYIVYPQTRHLSNKVRVFVDWLANLLRTADLNRP